MICRKYFNHMNILLPFSLAFHSKGKCWALTPAVVAALIPEVVSGTAAEKFILSLFDPPHLGVQV